VLQSFPRNIVVLLIKQVLRTFHTLLVTETLVVVISHLVLGKEVLKLVLGLWVELLEHLFVRLDGGVNVMV
jgi:hypothetical protein